MKTNREDGQLGAVSMWPGLGKELDYETDREEHWRNSQKTAKKYTENDW